MLGFATLREDWVRSDCLSVFFLMKPATNLGDIMKKLITTMALAVLITFTGQLHAQENARMSVEDVQQATVSTQGNVEGNLSAEATLWILLGIVFVTALATAGSGGSAAPAPAPS
jgi:hypothetical protein